MSQAIERLDQAPFPPMKWDDCDWWDGEIELKFGGPAGLTVTPYDPDDTRLPSDAQGEALRFQLENGEQVIEAVLASLEHYYQELRPRYLDFLGEDAERLMPAYEGPRQLLELIDLRQVHIHPWTRDREAYVGLQFGCSWDQEHGLGAMMHRGRVVEIGSAEVSFAWCPDEADGGR